MNTNETLNQEFVKYKNLRYWQCKKLIPVKVDDVINFLLKRKFVVEIDGLKYDIVFEYNKKENFIGQCIVNCGWGNPLCSYEVVQKGFREGKWYIVTDENLSKKEIQQNIKYAEEQKKIELKKTITKVLEKIKKNSPNVYKEMIELSKK